MKLSRFLLCTGVALAVVLVAALVLVFNSGFQTWAVRRVLAGRPGLQVSIDSVSAGLGRVEVRNLHLVQDAVVLDLPLLQVDVPVLAAGMKRQVHVSRLVATGWKIQLGSPAAAGGSANPAVVAPAAIAVAAQQAFSGVFGQLQLPVDLALDGVQLEGEVVLPGTQGRAKISVTGGGLGAGQEGKFDVTGDATLTDPNVNQLALRGRIVAAMDTPRTFTRLDAKADASATGPKFPNGVKLSADLAAVRGASGENYTLTVASESKQLCAVQAAFAQSGGKLAGTWKIDLHDTDLAPFALGRPLPAFAADGAGTFEADAAFAEIHGTGKLNAASDSLAAINPALAAMGAVRLVADFDLAKRGDTTRVESLHATIAGAQPIATVESLQAFALNVRTGELQVADPARDLIGVTVQGVPLAWAQTFLPGLALTGGDLRGEFVGSARGGGLSLHTSAPLTANGVSLAQADKPLLRAVDVALSGSADYTPQGWQAEIDSFTAKSGAATLLSVSTKAGQLAGTDPAVKAVGKFTADLPSLLAQPAAGGAVALTAGTASGDFTATLDSKKQVQAKIALTGLAADPKLATEKLPEISADLRADIAANGQITLGIPLVIARDGRKSDFNFDGTLTPGKDMLAVDARVTSTLLVVDDAKVLAAVLAPAAPSPPAATAAASKPAARDAAPPWAGVSGQVALALKKVAYSDSFQATDVTGALRLDAGVAKLEKLAAGLGGGSDASVSGAVTFDPKAAKPYALTADLAIKDFDPAPLFRAMNPGQPPTVEGKFVVTSKLAGDAASLGDLATNTHGDFQLSSKGGVFRGLPVNVATKNETVGKIAAGAALLGSALDVFKGRKEDSDITSTAKAVAEVSKMFAAIPYDQLSLVVSRDPSFNATLKDFTLISPEMRITGGGQTTHQAGKPLLDDALAMEFKLRARGHTADLLKFLGKLEPQPDELGYSGCTLPLKVGGTLGKPDTTELNNALAAIAVEKSGVLDKAGDLLNRLIPGGK